jgi:lipoprotein signal peptidase
MSTARRRRRLAVGAALAVLAADLGYAVVAPATPFHHARSAGVLVLAGALAAALLALAPRVPSLAVALGAGIAAGGALGTVVSGIAWSEGVPNPIVRGGIAFNVADVAIAAGDALLLAAALAHAWANRSRLREPV